MNNFEWLFVYGTLRPGNRLYHLLEPAVYPDLQIPDVLATGALYHVRSGTDQRPIYPVADFTKNGIIRGDLLLVDLDSEDFDYVDGIETASGYIRCMVDVIDDAGKRVSALSYHYEGVPGDRIESGDWNNLCATR